MQYMFARICFVVWIFKQNFSIVAQICAPNICPYMQNTFEINYFYASLLRVTLEEFEKIFGSLTE